MSRYYTITTEDGEPYVTGFDALALARADASATGGQVLDAMEYSAWLAALRDDLSGYADDGMAACPTSCSVTRPASIAPQQCVYGFCPQRMRNTKGRGGTLGNANQHKSQAPQCL